MIDKFHTACIDSANLHGPCPLGRACSGPNPLPRRQVVIFQSANEKPPDVRPGDPVTGAENRCGVSVSCTLDVRGVHTIYKSARCS